MRKVFCIGPNKTGTTSLAALFRSQGYRIGNQAEGEILFTSAYANGDWQSIVEFAKSADFFQDLPFSARHTYREIHRSFPDAQFILSTRSSADVWYRSLTAFHKKKFGRGKIPDREALQSSSYRYKGFMWEANRLLYNTPETEPYQKSLLIKWYEDHLQEVRSFFAERGDTGTHGEAHLLEVDIAAPDTANRITNFVGFKSVIPLPHLNRTEE